MSAGRRWFPRLASEFHHVRAPRVSYYELQVPPGRSVLKNKSETSRASKLEVSPNRLLALIMAGVGMLNHEPHRTLPTVPYGPSGFSGMVEEHAKRWMPSDRDYSS